MNVHRLINLPGYGNAQKELRKAGLWQLTPEEQAAKIFGNLARSIDDAKSAIDDADNELSELERAMEALEE